VGLLDNLYFGHNSDFGGQGGGLLDFLRTTQMQQNQYQPSAGFPGQPQAEPQATPLDIGGYQMPRIGTAAQFTPDPATLPQNAQPAQGYAPPQAPQPPQESPGGFGEALRGIGMNMAGGPIGMLLGGAMGAMGKLDPDPRVTANQTAQFLVSKGINPALAKTIASDPATLRSVIPSLISSERVRPATAEERKKYGAPEDLPMAIDTATGKPSYGPAGQKTNVSLNTVANPVLKGVGDQIVAQRETAQTAARQTIPFVHQARQALDEGAITGQFADQKIFAQKVAGLFGLPTGSASNTEVFRAAVGNQVLAQIKALGANPSNADRDYIEKIQGGQVTLEEKSLRRLLDITEKYARASIRNFNTDAGKLISAKPDSYTDIAPLMRFDEPEEYRFTPPAKTTAAPAAVPGGGWQNLGNGVKIRPK